MVHLMTVNETAQNLNISIHTVYALVHQQRIPHVKIGKALRFHPGQIEAWVDACSREPNSRITLPKSHTKEVLIYGC